MVNNLAEPSKYISILFVLLNKLLNLLETTDVDDAWFEEFILNPKLLRDKAQKLNKINTQIIEQYQLLEPFLNMNEMTYELMDELVHSKRYVKIVKGLLNKDDLKRHRTNASIVATNLKLYFEKVTELKAELPKETKLNILDENTWGNYLSFLNFIDLLTPWETIVLNLFIKKTQSIKNFKRSDLIKDLVILRENQHELEVIETGLATFNLRITGSNFIESVKSIKSYIPYLAQVLVAIENIKSYFKNSANITTYDVLYLIEIDKQFTESKKHFEENDEYFYCERGYNSISKNYFKMSRDDYDTGIKPIDDPELFINSIIRTINPTFIFAFTLLLIHQTSCIFTYLCQHQKRINLIILP